VKACLRSRQRIPCRVEPPRPGGDAVATIESFGTGRLEINILHANPTGYEVGIDFKVRIISTV
jgi:hypothetical protein